MGRLILIVTFLVALSSSAEQQTLDFKAKAMQMENVEDVWQEATSQFENGDLDAARVFFKDVISRTSTDSTRSSLDFEARLMMSHVEEQAGNLDLARKWLNSINIHGNSKHYTVQYPDKWQKRLAIENIRLNQTIQREQELKAKKIRAIVILSLVELLLIILFISLYIEKTQAYKVLAKKAEAWAKEAENAKAEPLDEIQQIAIRISEHFESTKCYLTPGFKLDDLVSTIGSNRTYVSRAINSIGPNFSALVNEYRIKEAVRMIEAQPETALDEIAVNCGFNNRKSFNMAFKTYTGLTPSEFKRNR